MSKKAITFQKKFGERLKELRLSKNLSQLELSINCDLEKTAISRIENGRTNVTLKTIVVLSKALEVEVKELFDF